MEENIEAPEGQEGAPPPQPEAPQQEDVAQQYGYDPELFRSQYEEVKRREREVEKRERDYQNRIRELEQKHRFPDPSLDMLDPVQRSIMERQDRIERILTEEREERMREREEAKDMDRLTRELDTSYVNAARMMGLTKEQMDAQAAEVFDTLVAIYPERSMIRSIGPDVAIRNAFRLVRNGNGAPAQSQVMRGRGPRTEVVIPGATGAPAAQAQAISDVGPQRPNETAEQYSQRLARVLQEAGIRGLVDGQRVSSG